MPRRDGMDKIDILTKGCPVPIYNMFNGYCSIQGRTVSEGVIELMIQTIEKANGRGNAILKNIVDEYRVSAKRN